MFQNAGIIRQHKETIKKAEEVSKIQELNEQKLLKGEEPAPITEQMKNEMMSSEQIAQTKKFIRDLEYENTAYGKIIWTNNNYNSAIFGLDKRPGEVFKQDMYNVDGSKKYADMKETRLPSINLKEFAENLKKKGIDLTVVDARFAKPLDENLIWQIATNHEAIITIEEGAIGGFGSHVNFFLNEKNLLDNNLKFRSMILPDKFIDHNKPEIMYKEAGLDAEAIVSKVFDVLNSKVILQKQN